MKYLDSAVPTIVVERATIAKVIYKKVEPYRLESIQGGDVTEENTANVESLKRRLQPGTFEVGGTTRELCFDVASTAVLPQYTHNVYYVK